MMKDLFDTVRKIQEENTDLFFRFTTSQGGGWPVAKFYTIDAVTNEEYVFATGRTTLHGDPYEFALGVAISGALAKIDKRKEDQS